MKTIFLFTLASFTIIPVISAQEAIPLKTGDKAPVFSAYDDNNQLWESKKYTGRKNIVIFFYPAAMTGGCTNQACAYRDSYAELEKEDAIVVGISGDEVENLKLFKITNNLNFSLLSDPSGDLAKKFGVPVGAGNIITREINGIEHVLKRGVTAKRWTYIINKEGKIAYVNQEVNASRDSQDVLNVLKTENLK